MYEIEIDTITPLFIAGADQRNIENEGLRAPSLRGLLRWWFRAIMGGIYYSLGNLNLKIIKDKEEKIWGSTDRKSKVILAISPVNSSISYFQNIRKKGVKYLSYGSFDRPYLEPESRFKLRLSFRQLASDDVRKVIAALWLLLNLGNAGSKSRKGFGSLRVVKDTTIEGIEFRNPSTLEGLVDYIEKNLKKCFEFFKENGSKTSSGLPSYSVISPDYWKMKILDNTHVSPIDAINYIGEKIRGYRENKYNPSAKHTRHTKRGTFSYWVTKDYNAVKGIYVGTHPMSPQGSIFGLPHQFQFQSINKKAIVKGTELDRRASPLFIKVWKLNDNQFVIGLQLFKSLFLPENKLRISDIRNPNIRADVNIPSYSYLERFLDQLSGRWVTL